jgi:N-carbamoylputrescine amidase
MQTTRVGLIQLAWTGDRATMKDQYRQMVAEAAERGSALVCLPEFSLSPYFAATTDPAGFKWAEALPGGESEQFFAELARSHRVTLIGSLFERTPEGVYYDTATIHNVDGQLIGRQRKLHIPSGEGYNETSFFGGGDVFDVFDVGSVKVAAPTCYDQWFPELARIFALNGAEYIFYPTAIGSEPTAPHVDSSEAWQIVMRGSAVANGLFIGAANRIGQENGLTFYGSSFICDPLGRVLAQAGRDTTEVLIADLDADVFAEWRHLFPLLRQRRPAIYGRIVEK